MSSELDRRMEKALRRLREECDYEDDRHPHIENYVLANKLAPDVGATTISRLLDGGFIVSGPNHWFNKTGYRITDLGRMKLKK